MKENLLIKGMSHTLSRIDFYNQKVFSLSYMRPLIQICQKEVYFSKKVSTMYRILDFEKLCGRKLLL